MKEAIEYKEWCHTKGYKPCDTNALFEYNEEKRTKRSRLFKSKMSLFGDTLDSLAECLGIVRQTLSNKIEGKYDFSQTEMSIIKTRYELTNNEYAELFVKESIEDESIRSSSTTQ